jgi:hypothetical protein
MTYAQARTHRANRSRILGSIFARTPRDTSASSEERQDPRQEKSASPIQSETTGHRAGWRDVASRNARETMAERLCARFFAHGGQRGASKLAEGTDADFASAGQHLQALSGDTENASVGQQNLAAILEASTRGGGVNTGAADDSHEAAVQTDLTARAA